jgi:hypothetical protein
MNGCSIPNSLGAKFAMKMMKWLFGVSLVSVLCLDSTAIAEKAL